MFESFCDLFSQYPELAVDVLEWGSIGLGITVGMICGGLFAFCSCMSGVFDELFRIHRDRKAKKSGKLTTEQRFELLEQKIDYIADIVISSSEEVK